MATPVDDATIVLVGRRRTATATARRLGWTPIVVGPENPLAAVRERLAAGVPRAVVAVSERTVQMAAELRASLGVDGMSVEVARRFTDKLEMKRAAAAAGIPTARWIEVAADMTADDVVGELGLPVVIKRRIGSGGRDVAVAHTRDLARALLFPGALAESFVRGVEMSVETFVARGEPAFRNDTQYLEPRWANVVPAPLAAGMRRDVHAVVDRVHRALGIERGMTHAEIFLTAEGPVFGEIAARPPGGYIMELIRLAYDFDPWEALLRIECGETPDLPRTATRAAAVRVLHPGPGTVSRATGLERARALPGVERVRLAVGAGDVVGPRVGAGQNVGEIVVTGADAGTCADRLAAATGEIHIAMAKRSP